MAIGFTVLTSTVRVPDKGMSRSTEPVRHIVQFGDGYQQRMVEGINPLKETYSVAFSNRSRAEIDDITAFFESKKAVTAFSFTIPDTNSGGNERTIKVVCSKWSTSYTNGVGSSLTATFDRVYEP